MGKKVKSIDQCRTNDDFTRYAVSRGAEPYNGRDRGIRYNGHTVPLGHANGELPIGTRKSIIRSFKALGLVILLVGLALSYMYLQLVVGV